MSGSRSVELRMLFIVALMVTLIAGCSPADTPSATPATSTQAETPLRVVALGDSWPEGAHCGFCETFAGRYADGLRELTGGTVEFVDLAGDAQPYFQDFGGGTASLLKALREDSTFRAKVARGDVIMIATGPNEIGLAFDPYTQGDCGKAFACVQPLEDEWRENFNAILDEIEGIRGDRPTAIRLVSAANFLLIPEVNEDLPADAPAFGARLFEALNTAGCDAAQAHGAVCVDVRPILNGPKLDQPVDENSTESMQAVADGLLAAGLPEFNQG
jgi:hypothetical protein